MSYEKRQLETHQIVCDLCGQHILTAPNPEDHGSLAGGYLSAPITRRTKRIWLMWPTPGWLRQAREKLGPLAYRERKYDFHAECIVLLVENAVAARKAATKDGQWPVDPDARRDMDLLLQGRVAG